MGELFQLLPLQVLSDKFSSTYPLRKTLVLPDCINDSAVERKLFALPHLGKFSPALLQILTAFKMSDATISNLHT